MAANVLAFFRSGRLLFERALLYSLRLAGLNVRAAYCSISRIWRKRLWWWIGCAARACRTSHMHFTSTVGLLAARLAPLRTLGDHPRLGRVYGSARLLSGRENPRLPLAVHHQRIWPQPIDAILRSIPMDQVPRRAPGRRSCALCAAPVPRESVAVRDSLRGKAGSGEGSDHFGGCVGPSGAPRPPGALAHSRAMARSARLWSAA